MSNKYNSRIYEESFSNCYPNNKDELMLDFLMRSDITHDVIRSLGFKPAGKPIVTKNISNYKEKIKK